MTSKSRKGAQALTARHTESNDRSGLNRDMEGRASDPQQRSDRLLWAVNTFGEVLARVFITPFPLLRLLDRLGFRELRLLDEAVTVMRDNMLSVIQDRREALAAGKAPENDLLGVLLQARDESGQAMTDDELWEDVHDIMGAGHETTATTTAAALHCISFHPEVEQRVLSELDSVLGGRAPTAADVDKLEYLNMAIKEVLRLYPAIPIFPREAQSSDRLPSGHRVDAGDVVFMSSYAMGRSPNCWENPTEFRPERFRKGAEAQLHKFQWVPFGAGPRMCLGAGFAQPSFMEYNLRPGYWSTGLMSVTLMVATLLQRFRFIPLHPMDVDYDITLNFQKTGGLRMEIHRRAAMSPGNPAVSPAVTPAVHPSDSAVTPAVRPGVTPSDPADRALLSRDGASAPCHGSGSKAMARAA